MNADPDNITVAMSSPTKSSHDTVDTPMSSPLKQDNDGALNTMPPPKKTSTPPLQRGPKRSHPNEKTKCRIVSGIESHQLLKEDLNEMGFEPKRVKEISGRKETRLPNGQKSQGDAAGDVGERRAGRGKGKEYECLRLGRDPSWVLFDPLRGYEPFLDKENCAMKHFEPPAIFQRYESYKAGNRRILEFNLRYNSVRLRAAPKELVEGKKEVEYTSSGPKLVDVKRSGRAAAAKEKKVVGKRKGKERAVEVEIEDELQQQEDSEGSDLTDLDDMDFD
ncbi:hypothetical protein LTR56_011934 [Elasticomyces elasticus]|nr:hypothetical protein LTR56_011934 [Elasticomyces elasticus]KAK3654798.1 hypothetical protein LTR22_010564 [Elasticomyces elasticus]KAK4920610.1 hypothetical protein LTR49_011857 [Elasticomyces elasticus]KAK5759362.1 hypothetical protein LTS12_010527 [Elasticomyces elasticus]